MIKLLQLLFFALGSGRRVLLKEGGRVVGIAPLPQLPRPTPLVNSYNNLSLILNFDGSAKDGLLSGGVSIRTLLPSSEGEEEEMTGDELFEGSIFFPPRLSESHAPLDAEIAALIEGLYALLGLSETSETVRAMIAGRAAKRHELDEAALIQIRGDCQILITHLLNDYSSKKQQSTRRLFRLASSLLSALSPRFSSFAAAESVYNLTHVPRQCNSRADALAARARATRKSHVSPPLPRAGGFIVALSLRWPLLVRNAPPHLRPGLEAQYRCLRLDVGLCGVRSVLSLQSVEATPWSPRCHKRRKHRKRDKARDHQDGDGLEDDWFVLDVGALSSSPTLPPVDLELRDLSRPAFCTQAVAEKGGVVQLDVGVDSIVLGKLPPVEVVVVALAVDEEGEGSVVDVPREVLDELALARARRQTTSNS